MTGTKADIIARLQKDILLLQGFRPILNNSVIDSGLGLIKTAFPGSSFPLGAIHEFMIARLEDAAATSGFVAGVLAPLMRDGGIAFDPAELGRAWIWQGRCFTRYGNYRT